MSLSIILPCYNEELNVEQAVCDVEQWLKSRQLEGTIIAVNDGSKDRTGEVLSLLVQKNSNLRIVTRASNGGYGIAVRDGCDAATSEVIAFMDSDGQFHAEDFDRLLPSLTQVTFVTGRRRKRADPLIRNVYGKVLGLFTFLALGIWVRDVNCGMKVFTRETWQKIRPIYGIEKLFNTELFLNLRRQRIPWKQIDVEHYPRLAGKPTGGSWRVILRMFKEVRDLRKAKRRLGNEKL